MRFEVMVTYTSKANFAVEADTAVEAYALAMAQVPIPDPQHVTYNVELNQGVN